MESESLAENDTQDYLDIAQLCQNSNSTAETQQSLVIPNTSLANKRNTDINTSEEEKIQNLKRERNETVKRKRKDESLENLIATCSNLGKNVENLIQTDKKENIIDEDYHFAISLVESLKKIKNNKRKMLLKASFLQDLAEAMDE